MRSVIRPAIRDDCAAIASMIAALAAETGVVPPHVTTAMDLIQSGFGDHPAFCIIIAEIGQPVGFCLYSPSYSTWRGTAGIYVADLYVATSARGTGLGRRLIAAAARAGPGSTGFVKLELDHGNAAALRLYHAIGFQPLDRDRLMVLQGPDLAALTGP